MNITLAKTLAAALAASLAIAPTSAFAKHESNVHADTHVKAQASTTMSEKAFGHLFAPGFLKHHATTTVSASTTIPEGIAKKDFRNEENGENNNIATSTHERDEKGENTSATSNHAAPVISAVTVTNVASTSATVSWTTNVKASGKVLVAPTASFNLATASAVKAVRATAHSVSLTGLTPATAYSFAVQSKAKHGLVSTSAIGSFTTGR